MDVGRTIPKMEAEVMEIGSERTKAMPRFRKLANGMAFVGFVLAGIFGLARSKTG